jgi:hypothetical protein
MDTGVRLARILLRLHDFYEDRFRVTVWRWGSQVDEHVADRAEEES